MKIQWLALSLVGLSPVCALAQPSTPAAKPKPLTTIVMDPAAQNLLQRAIQTYKGATGIRYEAQNTTAVSGKTIPSTSTVLYAAPSKLNISVKQGDEKTQTLADGSSLYLVIGSEYYKVPASAESVQGILAGQPGASQLIAPLMKGRNPFLEMAKIYFQLSPTKFKGGKVTSLEPRIVDGELMEGLRYSFSTSIKIGEKTSYDFTEEIIAWFGGASPQLQRMQSRTISTKANVTRSEKLVNQQLSPTFAANAFNFDSKGLKLASTGSSETYWDPKLKVGTSPIAFSAKDLDGKTISLPNYKGKVVLLDFWATWCGPCVAGLPELKEAYDKYHPKGFEVVGISLDEEKNDLTSFIKARKMPWPQVFDGKAWKSAIPTSYGVKAIPFLLLIGKDGKIAAVNPRGEIDKAVKAALAKS